MCHLVFHSSSVPLLSRLGSESIWEVLRLTSVAFFTCQVALGWFLALSDLEELLLLSASDPSISLLDSSSSLSKPPCWLPLSSVAPLLPDCRSFHHLNHCHSGGLPCPQTHCHLRILSHHHCHHQSQRWHEILAGSPKKRGWMQSWNKTCSFPFPLLESWSRNGMVSTLKSGAWQNQLNQLCWDYGHPDWPHQPYA